MAQRWKLLRWTVHWNKSVPGIKSATYSTHFLLWECYIFDFIKKDIAVGKEMDTTRNRVTNSFFVFLCKGYSCFLTNPYAACSFATGADLFWKKKYFWLIVSGWFVLREKYCWSVADKWDEQSGLECTSNSKKNDLAIANTIIHQNKDLKNTRILNSAASLQVETG
jgi:hypothetical protein